MWVSLKHNRYLYDTTNSNGTKKLCSALLGITDLSSAKNSLTTLKLMSNCACLRITECRYSTFTLTKCNFKLKTSFTHTHTHIYTYIQPSYACSCCVCKRWVQSFAAVAYTFNTFCQFNSKHQSNCTPSWTTIYSVSVPAIKPTAMRSYLATVSRLTFPTFFPSHLCISSVNVFYVAVYCNFCCCYVVVWVVAFGSTTSAVKSLVRLSYFSRLLLSLLLLVLLPLLWPLLLLLLSVLEQHIAICCCLSNMSNLYALRISFTCQTKLFKQQQKQ